jgi:hypothetical protein
MNEELRTKLNKFFQDPDWALVVGLMNDHLEPLKDVMSIDVRKSNDEIASEVRGRQLTINGLSGFLRDAGVMTQRIDKSKTTFQ